MHARQPAALPRLWLMTDERMGDRLWDAMARLPPGGGIVFRHYGLDPQARLALLDKVAAVARRRRLLLVVAGSAPPGWRGMVHGRMVRRGHAHTAPVHNRREAIAAVRGGAALLFVSPVHPTRSHPGAPALGPVRLALMIQGLGVPVVALGGMDARRARALAPLAIHGWAAIDAWTAPRRPR